ncbi:MAG TPA: sugar transferase, partial [Thermoleophilia bacterium]|nr:sugar transferase [Thermoleophilia bacterium]
MTRRGLVLISLTVDTFAILVAYGLAFVARFDWLVIGGSRQALAPDWSLAVVVAATLLSFLTFGLYRREAYLLRTLHVWTIAKATFVAFVFTAVVVYLAKSPAVEQSRFVVVGTFAVVFVLVVVGRVFVITPAFYRRLHSERGQTLVIAGPAQSHAIARRLEALRGFSRVRVVEPEGPNDGHVAVAALAEGMARKPEGRARDEAAIESLFIDSSSLSARRTLELVRTARAGGVEVYVLSPLLSPLDGSRLLTELFEMPVAHVRRSPGERQVRPSKRVFDVAGAALALVLLAPLFGIVALAVKLSSRGPVFYRQERIGLRGRRFDLYKFRSMVLHDDHDLHREYVCRLIAGEPAGEASFEG